MKKNDIILITAILALALLALGMLTFLRTDGDVVCVKQDGKTIAEYPLSVDREERIESEEGGYNILVIRGGEAYVSEASCPDGICSSHRPVKLDGESIICLPNKLVIEIKAKEEKDAPDIVA